LDPSGPDGGMAHLSGDWADDAFINAGLAIEEL
jgi:hypothetical protein